MSNLLLSSGALAKNGSFDFAEGLASCVVAKANVPFVRLAKIVLKKGAVGKNKKHWVGLHVGFLVLSIFLFSVLSQWFTFQLMSFVSVFSHLPPTRGCKLKSRAFV